MALSDAQLDALARRHVRLTAEIRLRVVGYVTRAWGSLDGHRDADIDRFVRAVVPVVEAGQVRVAALTDGYLAILERGALGVAARPVGQPAEAATALRGVPTAEVYQRAGVTVWTALSRGVPYDQAVAQGLKRATDLAATDMQLAETHTARRVLTRNPRVVGYRRTLSGGQSCALCAVASTQRYRKQDLMPIHPGCSCKVQPIYGNRDPGRVIDPDRLAGVHQRIAERLGVEDRGGRNVADFRQLVVTHDHGELGPILTRAGDRFTGPGEI